MGKPFNDQGGSGTHLHLSLARDDAQRVRRARSATTASAASCAHFTAGVIGARAGADGAPQPDDQRLPPDPARLAGADPRQLGLGQPRDVHPHPARARRIATRIELRVGDGAANPYLAIAAVLLAGADGVRREADAAGAGRRRRLPGADPDVIGTPAAARRSSTALDALESDALLREGLGEEIVDDVPGDEAASRSSATAAGSPTGRSPSTSTTSRRAQMPSTTQLHRPLRPRRRSSTRFRTRRSRQLRREDPVHWNPEPDGRGFWAVTRYEDIRAVHRNPDDLLLGARRHLARGPRARAHRGPQVDDRHGPAPTTTSCARSSTAASPRGR